jgi:uncharacterized surface protein with fasciclin (FAS1) repeats
MKVFENHKITISMLLLLVVLSITVFSVSATLTSHVETKYQSYTINKNASIFENLESIPEFSIFLSDSVRTGIDTILKDTSKNLVALIPNNEAYANINSDSRMKLEEPSSLHKLEKIIEMHVFEISNLTSFTTASEVRSINGQTIRFSVENGITMMRDAVGNVFEFDKTFYEGNNGYFAKVTQVLLPFNVSDMNGAQIEVDENIKENIEVSVGADKFNEEQDKELENDNITFLYNAELNTESNIKDYIITGSYNTYQLELVESVKTLSGLDLKVTKNESQITVGDIVLDRNNSNLESKNGFIHLGL